MATKLFVGSLSFSVNDDQLKEFFAQAGNVVSAKVITDRESDRSRGFGFVEMSTDQEAQTAIDTLNGQMLDGRGIKISEARPKTDRPQGGFRQ